MNPGCAHTFKFWLLMLFVLASAGCGGGRMAPVSEQSSPLRAPESEYRIVVPGDTLYSIAWESAVDHKALARWNRIGPPYIIKPGQKLRLTPPRRTAAKKPNKSAAKPPIARRTKTTRAKPPVRVARAAPVPARKPAGKSVKRSSFGPWVWPAEGKVITYSANSRNRGLDIIGQRGQPVRAAANGRVVYSGSGLRGYGQLIILKHNEEYLSAYAHNEKIYVKEGSMIKRGQQIAEMGSSGTNRVKLHFQIRRRGAPVDPLPYLPKK